MSAANDWVLPVAKDFLDRWRVANGDYTANQSDLVTHWLRSRLLDGEESFGDDQSFYFVADWAGIPTLVLISDERVVLMQLDGMEIETQYLGPLSGGTYSERWRYLEKGDRFELELVFEHDSLPAAISMTFQTLREIEQPPIEPLRQRFRSWAEKRSPRPAA